MQKFTAHRDWCPTQPMAFYLLTVDDCYWHGIAISGTTVSPPTTASSAENCHLACYQTSGCILFTFDTNDNSCALFKDTTGEFKNPGSISGLRVCQGNYAEFQLTRGLLRHALHSKHWLRISSSFQLARQPAMLRVRQAPFHLIAQPHLQVSIVL
jgi:hypothetical protein